MEIEDWLSAFFGHRYEKLRKDLEAALPGSTRLTEDDIYDVDCVERLGLYWHDALLVLRAVLLVRWGLHHALRWVRANDLIETTLWEIAIRPLPKGVARPDEEQVREAMPKLLRGVGQPPEDPDYEFSFPYEPDLAHYLTRFDLVRMQLLNGILDAPESFGLPAAEWPPGGKRLDAWLWVHLETLPPEPRLLWLRGLRSRILQAWHDCFALEGPRVFH